MIDRTDYDEKLVVGFDLMSRLARLVVGTARLVEGTASHEKALHSALTGGSFSAVDTAASYGAGSSERLVGKVLSSLSDARRRDIELMSKFGFYVEHSGNGNDVIGADPSAAAKVRHAMSPFFMRSELDASLRRLGTSRLDAFLVDSPERALQPLIDQRNKALIDAASASALANTAEVLPSNHLESAAAAVAAAEAALQSGRDEMLSQLTSTFIALEEEVAAGRVGCYGVSSDALALEADDPLRLPWRDVLRAAETAAREVGSPPSAFRILQLPTNVLEPGGGKVAREVLSFNMQRLSFNVQPQRRLRVMGTRPLTTVMPLQRRDAEGRSTEDSDGGLGPGSTTWQRLVDFAPATVYLPGDKEGLALEPVVVDPLAPAPGGYMSACQDALAHFSFELPTDRSPSEEETELYEACRWLQQLLGDMNQQLVHFVSVAHYEQELSGQIMPMLNDKFEELDAHSAAVLQHFLAHYHGMVRYHAAEQIRKQVQAALRQSDSRPPEEAMATSEGGEVNENKCDSLYGLTLGWALERPGISDVVVGITQESHADDARELLASRRETL